MHEMGLMNDLLAKIRKIAADHNAEAVAKVEVRLGALAHISESHFKEHFVHGSRGTLAEGAELVVRLDTDIHAAGAQDILLERVEVVEAE